jgi:hypothetical protein
MQVSKQNILEQKEVCKQFVKNWTFQGEHEKKLNKNALC